MNRLYHLKETLLKNIEDNISYEKLEFILLDYNSSDGLEEWVKSKLAKYIDNGILRYHRTSEPKSFHRSHSRNVALKLGSGDILCNLDADNFLGNDFASYVNYNFSFNKDVFLTSGFKNGSYGKICVKKEHFLKIKGYDERMSGWGYEDDDLYFRLNLLGINQVNFFEKKFYSMVIFSQNNEKTKVDFRNYDREKPNKVGPYKLPKNIESKLIKLMETIGLNTGSIDLVKGLDGDYYFLEVNPSGQFGMTSFPCNYNLHKKVANYLITNN